MIKTTIAVIRAIFSTLFDMVRQDAGWRNRAMLVVLGGLMLGITAVLLTLIHTPATADYELPPREEPPNSSPDVTVTGGVGTPIGVRVHLEGVFPTNWPWETAHWQESIWHEVEWYSEQLGWTKVDGWRGRFDTIYQEEPNMIGKRELWAEGVHAGSGPYRWVVYDAANGRLLTISDNFYMPQNSGDIVTVRLDMVR